MARLRKEKKANLKREEKKNHKITLNALIMASRDIILKIVIRNRNKTKKLERKPKS
jgi:hypothetical protein